MSVLTEYHSLCVYLPFTDRNKSEERKWEMINFLLIVQCFGSKLYNFIQNFLSVWKFKLFRKWKKHAKFKFVQVITPHTHTCMHISTKSYVELNNSMWQSKELSLCMHVYIHAYIHTSIYIYIYIYIYTYLLTYLLHGAESFLRS